MKGITKKITSIALCSILIATIAACGSHTNVIEQAEEKCGVQSERGEKIEYAFSLDEGYGNANTLQCLTNLMPDDIYEHYKADEKKAALHYETQHEPLRGQYDKAGYRWQWRMLFDTTFGPSDEVILYIEKL